MSKQKGILTYDSDTESSKAYTLMKRNSSNTHASSMVEMKSRVQTSDVREVFENPTNKKETPPSLVILHIIFFLCCYFYSLHNTAQIGYSQSIWEISLISVESSGNSTNLGYISIDSVLYSLPAVINVTDGNHIVYYMPEWEYFFVNWDLIGNGSSLSEDQSDNPNLISIHNSSELIAYYEVGPQIDISRSRDMPNLFYEKPVKLEVKVKARGKPVEDAEVTFQVDQETIGSNVTDSEGHSTFLFTPEEERIYSWNVSAKKGGFVTGHSNEWDFAFQTVTLDPTNDEVKNELPIFLHAVVRLNETPVEDASVSFYLDDIFLQTVKTQGNGYSTCTIDNTTVGLHTWHVTVDIIGWDTIVSDKNNFTYVPEIEASLIYPGNGEEITNYTSIIKLQAIIETYRTPIQEANVSFYVSGRYVGCNFSGVDGLASFNFHPEVEDENFDWYVTASKTSYVSDTSGTWSFYYPVQPPYVEVDQVYASRMRGDIDSQQEIGFHLKWENGSDVKSALIVITDNHEGSTGDSGWVNFTVSESEVGMKEWKIMETHCSGMGEFKHNRNYPRIIWDRIFITLSVEKNRVDVGSNVIPYIYAYYEYDMENFSGLINFNADFYSNSVSGKKITVNAVQDNKYGLSNFISNEVEVIWDRVKIEIHQPETRFKIGTDVGITYNAIYEYDKKQFEGNIKFDNKIKNGYIGKNEISVSGISDTSYNLTIFESNEAFYVFDDIEIEQTYITHIPFQIKVITNIYYKYDKIPVDNAIISVNGINAKKGIGSYESKLFNFFPFSNIVTSVKLENWDTQIIENRILLIGNSILELSLILGIFLISSKRIYIMNKNSKLNKQKRDLFWGKLIIALTTSKEIKSWTAHSGYIGKGDFTAQYHKEGYIECKEQKNKYQIKVKKEDIDMMYDRWDKYMNKNITRQELSDKSRFTKYSISLLHQYEHLM